jgi:LPS sulfotransferase NodH
MAGKPAVELAKEWVAQAEEQDAKGMGELLSDDAVFYHSFLRGQRFTGREQIERYFDESGFEAAGYAYTAIDDEYAVVTLSVRRKLRRGMADATLAMVFKADGDEIICMDVFTSERAALESVSRR